VHYLNEVLHDMDAIGTSDYRFADHAEHWSEMKGFALGMQFNPMSRLDDAAFSEFHTLVGDVPVLSSATDSEIADYEADLVAARGLMGTACGFDTANLGGDSGVDGW